MDLRFVGAAFLSFLMFLVLLSGLWVNRGEHTLEQHSRRLSFMGLWSNEPLLQVGRLQPANALRRAVFRDFHILRDAQLMNCAIHKDASTTMRDFFAEVIGAFRGAIPESFDEISCVNTLGEAKCRSILVNDQQWIKMSVVRDPEERLVSAFLDKCARPDGPRKACILRFFPSVFGNATTIPFESENKHKLWMAVKADRQGLFEEFTRSVVSAVEAPETRCRINHHFAPQTCFCGFEDPHLLQQYELFWIHDITPKNLDQRIIRRLAVSDDKKDHLRQVTRARFAENLSGDHATAATAAQRSMMTPELVALVRRAFARDFELLGRVWGQDWHQPTAPQKPPMKISGAKR